MDSTEEMKQVSPPKVGLHFIAVSALDIHSYLRKKDSLPSASLTTHLKPKAFSATKQVGEVELECCYEGTFDV